MITTKIILVCSSGFNLLKPRTLKCFDSVFHLCDTAADICGKYQDRLFHGAFLRFLDNCKDEKLKMVLFFSAQKKGATIISHFYSWDISIDSQHRPPYISYSLSLKNFMSYHVVFRKLYFLNSSHHINTSYLVSTGGENVSLIQGMNYWFITDSLPTSFPAKKNDFYRGCYQVFRRIICKVANDLLSLDQV